MTDSGRPWHIYGIIGIGVIGIIAILWLLLSRRDGQTPSPTGQSLQNNHIIESNSLPSSCQSFKETMNCLIRESNDNNPSESLINYYRETLSARNILPPDQLTTACKQSLSYIQQQIQSLSGSSSICSSI